jgi:FRG domain-containing protein
LVVGPITTWDGVNKAYVELSGRRWLFRGQEDAGWGLKPSLERVLERFELPIDELREYESLLLREFKRHFHRYSLYVPPDDDDAEWLTMMQHHGAPTRLLDWTYSFHVALFFAVESAKAKSTCAIWAVDNDFLVEIEKDEVRKKFSKEERRIYDGGGDKDPRILKKFLYGDASIILPMNSLRLNERLTIQQGAFLFSQSLTEPFSMTFERLRKKKPDAFRKLEIVCSKELLVAALWALRSVNIGRVSLFPGLDGFSQSFKNLPPLTNLWRYLRKSRPFYLK